MSPTLYVNPNVNLGASPHIPAPKDEHVDSVHFFGKAYVKTTMKIIFGFIVVIFLCNLFFAAFRWNGNHNYLLLSIFMAALSFFSSAIFFYVVFCYPTDFNKRRWLKWAILPLIVDEWLLGYIAS